MGISDIKVTKASGIKQLFSIKRLIKSLRKSGATRETALQIAKEVSKDLYEGISTKKIYRLAFNKLKSNAGHLAARYHLKAGILELGPSGFPFERFVAALLSEQGYSVLVGEIVKGKCVNHEIDVIAEKGNQHFMIECKFHNLKGTVSDVKIPLYIQSRFKDVESSWVNIPGHSAKFHQGWVVNNTRFTHDAINYGKCAGLNLISWDYPKNNGLKDIIDDLGLYPLTCLTSLTRIEKQKLLDMKVVLCKELCNNSFLLKKIGISSNREKKILAEGHQLCNILSKNGKH